MLNQVLAMKFFNNLDKLINDIKNKETKRKNTIEKIRNNVSDLDQQRQKEKAVFQNKMIDFVYYLFNLLGISSKPGRLMLPKWVKVSEERFNEILSSVTKTKNEGLKANVGRREITLDNTERLLKDLGSGKIDKCEFTKKYNIISDDVKTIKSKSLFKRSQNKMVKILLPIEEIVYRPRKKSNIAEERTDTTDTSEESEESTKQPDVLKLESEVSAAERRNQPGQGLKILTPDQMVSKLPITLAQLKARNNSQKLINEIRQLLCSLYRSKKLTKAIYNHLINYI